MERWKWQPGCICGELRRRETARPWLHLLVIVFLLVEYTVLHQAWSVRSNAVATLETDARLTTRAEARELSQLMNDLYVTTRTISMLPAVRKAPMQNRLSDTDDVVDGKRFAATDAQTCCNSTCTCPT